MNLGPTQGPRCEHCGGASTRAVRSRGIPAHQERIFYLAYLWSCSVCGQTWVDEPLERLNACAAEGARLLAYRAS
jgi:hypothetical protein